ncbi:MAG: cbb3-type cytochrome oxidase assembly protein [Nevskia sp.]|jgi:cbb3-type cytochrome oxidase maturation protein|nr:cbb3-type cytochrome oxidase assembly protein [Gammaproteobacteria bacterium]MDH4458447.1 cbb3-type cytochrome oxidase assembly protein [Nevskia sp.]
MSSLYLLIPLGVLVVFGSIAAFVSAVFSGQFEELDAQADKLPDDER